MKKYLTIHKNHQLSAQKPTIDLEALLEKEGHLTDSGLTLYVEARLLKREAELPDELLEHIDDCPRCQQDILEMYQWMKKEDLTGLVHHPYFEHKPVVHKQVKLRQLPAQWGQVAAVFLLTVLACVVYWLFASPAAQSLLVRSPFENPMIDVPFNTLEIDVSEGKVFYFANGSYFKVPAHAFQHQNGEIVQGKVEIQYREIKAVADLLASGISANTENQTLETTGIFEIRGWQGNKRIKLATGKTIEVNMVSNSADKDFAHYFLKENQQLASATPLFMTPAVASSKKPMWQYIGVSQLKCDSPNSLSRQQALVQKGLEIQQLERSIQAIQESTKIPETYAAQPNHTIPQERYKLNLNTAENPTLLKYQDQTWQYAGEHPTESPTQSNHWVMNETWDELRLKIFPYKSLSLKGHQASIKQAVFSPDGALIATACADGTARLWSSKAQYLTTLQGHTAGINTVVFSPDGNYILTASDDHTAKVWNVMGEKMFTLSGHQGSIQSAVFSPNGKWILTTSTDHTARLWTAKGDLAQTFSHQNPNVSAQFSPNSQWLVNVPNAQSAVLYSVQGDSLTALKGSFQAINFSPDSRYLITCPQNTSTGKVTIWTVKGNRLQELDFTDSYAAFSPSGSQIVSYTGKTARLWHWNTNYPYTTQLLKNMKSMPKQDKRGHEGAITQLYFSADGKLILTASADHTAGIWNKNGDLLHTLSGHTSSVLSVNSSPTGSHFLTASADNTAKIWTYTDEKDLFEMELIRQDRTLVIDNMHKKIKGKRFCTLVKLADSQTDPAIQVMLPNKAESAMAQLLQRYERAIAEQKAIENLTEQNPVVCFRTFQISTFGFYNCAKLLDTQGEKIYQLKLPPAQATMKVNVFRIRNGIISLVQPIAQIKNNALEIPLNPEKHDRLLVLFPKDYITIYQPDSRSGCGAKSQICSLKLQTQARVYTKSDLDRLLLE
jgi:WD40 repeat protein